MSDASVAADEVAEPAADPAQETDWKAKYEETLGHSRKWEERAKANADAATRLAEFEESQKSEQQKLEERAAKAEHALASKEREAARLAVIAAKGIPADYQHLVQGDSDESLTAAADSVAALVAKTTSNGGPLIIPSEGNTPTTNPGSADDWLRGLPRN